jgi:phosphoglycerate dehydrogenase-like enzyme
MGAMPTGLEVRLAPESGPVPDLSQVDLVVPTRWMRTALLQALAEPGRLRVIQTLSAGVDWLIGHVPDSVEVCNARGVFDVPLAEWVVGAILGMQRGFPPARDAQGRGEWVDLVPRELAGRRVVILGYGSIGATVASRLQPFDVEIIGVARTARDGVPGIDALDDLLPRADVLVDLLPLTGETAGFLDRRRLGRLPDGALVVNAGRGRTVDTDALVAELRTGRLRAALDVTDPEPLPPGHELWRLPNALITPHVAGDSPDAEIRAYRLAGDQIRRLAAGRALRNRVPRYQLA